MKSSLSKTLNTTLFGKRLEFFYVQETKKSELDSYKRIIEQKDLIDLTRMLEIEVRIEHIGAWKFFLMWKTQNGQKMFVLNVV